MSSRNPQSQEHAGFLESLRGFVENIAVYLSLRIRLAGLEGREAGKHVIKLLVLVVSMILLLVLGWIFSCITVAFLIAAFVEGPNVWLWTLSGFAIFHLATAAGIAFVLKKKIKTPLFPQSAEEFKKDQEWLKNKQRTNRN